VGAAIAALVGPVLRIEGGMMSSTAGARTSAMPLRAAARPRVKQIRNSETADQEQPREPFVGGSRAR